MKEIKFRAWSITGKQMIGWERMLQDRILYKYFKWGENYHLMQYTGIKDKNGVEIYEGDIVEFVSMHGKPAREDVCYRGCVFFPMGSATFTGKGELFEVIGNIYENPELLKGK